MTITFGVRPLQFGLLLLAFVLAIPMTAAENEASCEWKLALFGRAYDVDYSQPSHDLNGELLPVWNRDDTGWVLRRALKERRPVRLQTMGFWRFGTHYPAREAIGLVVAIGRGAVTLQTQHGYWRALLSELDRRHLFIGDPIP